MKGIVMIVDDSKTVRASVEYNLSRKNYKVWKANDGQKALELLEDRKSEGSKPDMIISDINMPNMGGIEFINKLKSKRGFKFIPVLVLTTESQPAMKEKGKKAGAAGWLVKPFEPEQLLNVVSKFVK